MTIASPLVRAIARCATAAVLLTACVLTAPVTAQNKAFSAIPAPKDFNAEKKSTAMTMISSGSMAGGDEKLLKDFFQSYFAELTSASKAQNLHKTRANIKKQLVDSGNASDQSTHDAANRLMLEILPNIIKKPTFHPGVRYNCTLLLGDLDSVEKKSLNDVATPYPAALDKLIELLTDKNVNDSIRLAAILGMTRHAAAGDAATRAKVAKQALAFLDRLDKSDSAARKQDVKFWLESRTMECLAATVTPTPEVVAALQTRLADENRPVWLRSAAAQSLGKLTFDANAKVDANALVPDFKKLVDLTVDQGLNRRELRSMLYSVNRGLEGYQTPAKDSLSLLLTGEAKKQATAMTNAVGEMAKVCDNKDVPSTRVPSEIEKVVAKWRSGGFSDTKVDATVSEALKEDTSGSEDADEAPAEGDAPADESNADTDVFGE